MPWKTKTTHCGPCWGTGSTQRTEYYTDFGGMSQCRTVSAICTSCGGSGRKSESVWEADAVSTSRPTARRKHKTTSRKTSRKTSRRKKPFYQVKDKETLKRNRETHTISLRRNFAHLVAFFVAVIALSSDTSLTVAIISAAIVWTVVWLTLATILRPIVHLLGVTTFFACRVLGAA